MKSPYPGSVGTTPASVGDAGRTGPQDTDETTCPRCGESHDLAKVKGCIKCLKCGFKFDCNGW
jgi:hypothetical protein